MLAPELMQNMEAWGYPYVGNAFRFHMTLTSQLAESRLEDALGAITGLLPCEPVMLDAISVYADPGDVRPFERVERHVLKA
jgi:sulfite exporter TauE/SafE